MQAPKMTLPKLVLSLAAGLGALVLGGVAYAQCCSPPPPPCCAPPPAPPRPPAPPPGCNTCGGGHNVNIPGINIHVGGSIVVNANASASAVSNASAGSSAGAGASAGSTVYYGGGTHGGYYSGPVSTGYIQGLNVEGGEARRRAAYEATRTRFKRVVIRAVCLDDRDIPHPASQVTPDRDIDSGYDGELYRCIAGSRMQYVVGAYEGISDINSGGETYLCGKNEALYYAPGAQGGTVACRPQRPARDCNERSLLRRYGAGVKILTMLTVEKYTAYREETVRESSMSGMSLSLDGGVGGVVY
ncbi:hypothetical protein PMI01_04600 [Caulobacter sp. AP07]|uniref:hypothetical protein n=1 Tax=Caulobacter sp. AP07 TaxID=1144304 RepID=UPI00027220C2|nr:hypothetical protein [Caulobacter sp. AP07]EJL24722.1 hypothetical protein PMI01_04600 [Caulobacter sp. AP07]